MIVLPKEKTEVKICNPKFSVFYGKPKAGKSSLMASLDNNLIIDLENGYQALSALVVQARSVKDFGDIVAAIREEIKNTGKRPYKYITIDNATRLEEICMAMPYSSIKALIKEKIIKVQTFVLFQMEVVICG